jgi:outer membrane protein OmpA-like peptidoglycan-associated protein
LVVQLKFGPHRAVTAADGKIMQKARSLSIRGSRPARGAGWLAAIVAAAGLAAAPTSGVAQTTVIGGSGPESGVTVNLGVLDGGQSPDRRTRSATGTGTGTGMTGATNQPLRLRRPQANASSQGRATAMEGAEPGDLVRGPAGALLRFPPRQSPRSQLTVDPGQFGGAQGRQQARRQGVTTQPQTSPQAGQAPQLTPPGPDNGRPERGTTTDQDAQRRDTAAAAPAPSGDKPIPERPNLPEAPAAAEAARQMATSGTTDGSDTADEGTAATTDAAQAEADVARMAEQDAQAAQAGAEQAPRAETTDSGSAETGSADTRSTEGGSTEPSAPATDTAMASDTATASRAGSDAAADAGTRETADDAGQDTQTAALPPAEEAAPRQRLRLSFASGSASLSDDAKARLDELARQLEDNPRQRIQLMAFAEGTDDGASRARRLSLSRALSVRSYLIDQGVRSTRMDVRALGDTAEEGPLDRVDIVPANR